MMNSANSKRKHVTSACQSCRDSKIRCDGAHPLCGNCVKKDKECLYTQRDDKRRVSLRTGIDILSQRVVLLTDVLTRHGIAAPRMDEQQELALREICDTLQISLPVVPRSEAPRSLQEADTAAWHSDSRPLPLAGHPIHDELAAPRHSFASANDGYDGSSVSDGPLTDTTPVDWPWHVFDSTTFLTDAAILDAGFGLAQLDPLSTSHPVTGGEREHASSDEEQESDLLQQVSARFGALRVSSDGQLRYFGAATNYHLLEGSRYDEDNEFFETKQEIQNRLEEAGLNQAVSRELEQRLLELYFAWHNPSHVNVDYEAFTAGRASVQSSASDKGYCGDFLVSAICAIGAAYETRYHPTFVTYPRSLAEYFASRAKLLLEVDLECPTIGTIQGLCLLSNHEAARGRDARTWLYGGMAMRLCFDLGLHINCAPYVKAGVLTSADARARQSTFWSCVVLNHLSSFHFGRPFRIDSEEITVESPTDTGSYQLQDGRQLEGSAIVSTETQMTVLKEWVFLSETLVPLIRTLYGSSSTPVSTLQEVSESVTCQLEAWWRGLSVSLQVRDQQKPTPEVLLLHMAYHHFRILIHRPWTSRRSRPWIHSRSTPRQARRVCSTSAMEISNLLLRHEQSYGFGRMHNYTVNVIFSAALISLFNALTFDTSSTHDTTASQATTSLSIFFRALDDLGRSFDSAKRAREHLATIQRKWYLSGHSVMSNSKRSHPNGHDKYTQKRPRYADTQ